MIAILTGFGDEIHPQLAEQIRVMTEEHIAFLEIRSVHKTNVLELSDDELYQVRKALDDAHMQISAVASPIGKTMITDDDDQFRERYLRALTVAHALGTKNVRIFSFYLPEPRPEAYRLKILERFQWMVEQAENADITLLHENEKHIYGDTPERCLDLLESMHSSRLKAIFDPANFIQVGVTPFPDAYRILADYVTYVHVKDARKADGRVCVAGEGDGRWPEFVQALNERGFHGFFSLEPHLGGASSPGGGASGFTRAARALKTLLTQVGADIR